MVKGKDRLHPAWCRFGVKSLTTWWILIRAASLGRELLFLCKVTVTGVSVLLSCGKARVPPFKNCSVNCMTPCKCYFF